MTYQEAISRKADIFKSAWKVAHQGALKFGGKASDFFAAALSFIYSEIRRRTAATPTKASMSLADMVEAIYVGGKLGTKLTRWEKGFIADQANRVNRYGQKTLFSDKQAEIINKLYAKAA